MCLERQWKYFKMDEAQRDAAFTFHWKQAALCSLLSITRSTWKKSRKHNPHGLVPLKRLSFSPSNTADIKPIKQIHLHHFHFL